MSSGRRVAVLSGLVVAACLSFQWSGYARPSERSAAVDVADQLSEAFQAAADHVRNSVVRIRVVQRVEPTASRELPGALRQFFGGDMFDGFAFPQLPQGPYVQEGQGSGFVASADGQILTNNHVIRGADEVEVEFVDGRKMRATVTGADPKTDLAVVKVDATGLEPLRLGDSDELRSGEWVLAVGNPFGLSSTITAGIVSATGRSNVGLADYEDFIQTDAAINPGNSGGPLVNLHGEVVGVSTAIATRTGGYMGVGFAIPSNMVKTIKDQLIANGSVVRGLLGVVIQDLDEGLAQSFGFEGTRGVLVSDVTSDGPAAAAGVRPGDIVLRFDGHEMTRTEELRNRVAATAPGTEVALELFRDGEHVTLRVKIGRMTDDAPLAKVSRGGVEQDLGLEVHPLTPDIATRLGLEEDVRGVVVTRVDPLGAADAAGLRHGDVITSIDGRPVADVAEFRAELGRQDLQHGFRLTVATGRGTRFVYLRAADRG